MPLDGPCPSGRDPHLLWSCRASGSGELLAPRLRWSLGRPDAACPVRATPAAGFRGRAFRFLRASGNPKLSLDIRSSDSVTKGTGLIWLVLCVFGILLLIGPGRNGRPLVFCQRLFLILVIAGLAGWIATTGDMRAFGLMMCIGGAIGLAATTAITQMRNQSRGATQP